MRKLQQVIVPVILIASPYLLYGIAQTSRLHDVVVESDDVQRVASAMKPWKSLNGRDRHGSTPLSIAIRKGNLALVKLLLERGALIQFTSYSGEKFDHLVMAVDYGRRDLLQLLLENGARPDGVALANAVRKGDLGIVQQLLEYGAPVNAFLPSGNTPLFTGVELPRQMESRIEIVTLLLKNGGAIGARSLDGRRTLLSYPMHAPGSPRGPDLEMIELLLRNGFPVRERDINGNTQLFYAARAFEVEVVRLLLKYGADANDGGVECLREADCHRNLRGTRAALHQAVALPRAENLSETVDLASYYEKNSNRSAEIVSLLIKHGAKVNVVDHAGNTPLMIAIYSNNYPAAERLLKLGANWEIGNSNLKPMDIARKKKERRFVDLLVAYGAIPPR